MSTRSGKRIHSTVDENVESILENKSEKNTRSKRQKTNSDLPLAEKKRKHYVRYPSEEDVANKGNENIVNEVKNTRKSRRHTLKEQNILATDSETSNDERKNMRLTRRTKKFETEPTENVELNLEKPEGKKKGKKKKASKTVDVEENIENVPEIQTVAITKKKSNKKKNKKKSNSITVEDVTDNVNKNVNTSNVSNDSFHSAAGSPIAYTNDDNDKHAKSRKNKKNIVNEEPVDSEEKSKSKRKLSIIHCGSINDVKEIQRESLKIDEAVNANHVVINNEAFVEEASLPDMNKSNENSTNKERNRKSSSIKVDDVNNTYDIDDKSHNLSNKRLSVNLSFNNICKANSETENKTVNTTFNKENCNQTQEMNITYSGSKKKRKSSIKNSTYDKIENISLVNLNATFEKKFLSKDGQSIPVIITKESTSLTNTTITMNNTYDKNVKESSVISLNGTFEKPTKLDTTFDKSLKKDSIDQSKMNPQAKSSLISSDTTDNTSLNITDDGSRISITSDDSRAENIVNTTPVLIESSMDESKSNENTFEVETKRTPLKREGTFTSETKSSQENNTESISSHTPLKRDATFTEIDLSPKEIIAETKATTPLKTNATKTPPSTRKTTEQSVATPLKREGTFTKDGPDVQMSPKIKRSLEVTPRRKSLPSPGNTPFPLTKSSSKEKSVLNLTRSIEKPRRSSVAEAAPRLTRVMFCSPVNNPAIVTQMKGKVIKSNLKGSNKSFVFEESVSELSRPGRKRSYTQSQAESERDAQDSKERGSRSRTTSAAGRLQDAPTPSKKSKPEPRRTKLPNFAALHQKQFSRMESLDECVRRRAERARHLLTPSTPTNTLRTSPKESQKEPPQTDQPAKKNETPVSKQSDTNPGFTRFGFKLNLDVNPFSVPPKSKEVRPKDKPLVALKRQATLPSLAGATTLRRELAKQTVMREKSLTERRLVRRDEDRTVIKGVRTNRRFELQMKMRNINNK